MRHDALRFAVEHGSREASWVARFLPFDRTLTYEAEPLGAFPTVAGLLVRSNLGESLRARGIRHLLYTTGWNLAAYAWADHHGITLVAPPRDLQRDLEDKSWFARYLAEHQLPAPEGELASLRAPRDWSRRWVVQEPRSSGGSGTWFIDDPEDLTRLVDERWLVTTEPYLIRRRIEGRPLGITLLVTDRRLMLSALRRQCYLPSTVGRSDFVGLQWLPTRSLSTRAVARMNAVFERLARTLHHDGFRGHVHVDFMLDDDDALFILEANPRMSAASPQLLLHPTLSGLDPTPPLLETWLASTHGSTAAFHPIPPSTYEGATLDLVAATPPTHRTDDTVLATFYSGLQHVDALRLRPPPDPRELGAGQPFVCFPLELGTRIEAGCCLATVIGDDRLYNDDGATNTLGQRWLAELSRSLGTD